MGIRATEAIYIHWMNIFTNSNAKFPGKKLTVTLRPILLQEHDEHLAVNTSLQGFQ